MTNRVSVEERYEQIRPHLEKGMTAAEIGLRIGASKSWTQMLITRGRKEGALPGGRPRHMQHLDSINIGRPRAQLSMLPDEVQKWISEQIPEGSTLAEFMVACVMDAYYDEVGQ